MATRTRQLVPVVCDCLRFEVVALFVAIATRNCHVPAGQCEFCRFVPRQAKCRRLVCLQGVAALTTVKVWGRRKLSCMFVGVAVGTALKLDLEKRVFAFGDVASGTLHSGVSALQGIGRGSVVLYGKC